MVVPTHVCVLAREGDPVAARHALPRVSGWRGLRRERAELAWVRLPVSALDGAAVTCTLAGVSGVICTPLGPPQRLPWWERRFHRYLFASQDEAHAWSDVGVSISRMVVVEEDAWEREALDAVFAEVASMARRPGYRPGP